MRSERTTVGAIALACGGLLVAHALWHRGLFLGNCPDDAYISFRYADNLAAGRGLVFNPGERVEGYSNLSWVLLLSLFARRMQDLTLVAQLTGLLFALLSIPVALHAQRSVLRTRTWMASATTGLLIAASGYFAAWSVGGLETGLHALLLLCVWWRTSIELRDRERFPWSGVLVAALAATRPEGMAYVVVLVGFRLVVAVTSRKPFSRPDFYFILLAAGLTGMIEAWRMSYYGWHLFGSAVRAKTAFGTPILVRGLSYIGSRLLWPYIPLVIAPLFLTRTRPAAALATALVALHLMVLIAAGGDWAHGRLLAPILPILAVLGGAAFERGAAAMKSGHRSIPDVLAGAYIILCFAATSLWREAAWRRYFAPKDAERIQVGKWIRANTPEGTRIAVYAAGQVPYFSHRYTHDMLGLNDAHIADLEAPAMGHGVAGHEKFDVAYTLSTVRPDLIVDGRSIPDMRRNPVYQTGYVQTPGWRLTEVRVRKDLLAP